MHRQEKLNKPALIPNSLWKKTTFTTVCLLVLASTAVTNCMELFSSLLYVFFATLCTPCMTDREQLPRSSRQVCFRNFTQNPSQYDTWHLHEFYDRRLREQSVCSLRYHYSIRALRCCASLDGYHQSWLAVLERCFLRTGKF